MELYIACWYKEKVGDCAVQRVCDMWHKPGLWSSPKVMLSRYLLAHRKSNRTEDARVFHFIIFLILQKLDFLIFLGSCNKMPQAGWLINSRHLLLTVLETRNFKVKFPARSSTWNRALTKVYQCYDVALPASETRSSTFLLFISYLYAITVIQTD